MADDGEGPTPIGPHVPKPAGRPKNPVGQWRPIFLQALGATGNVSAACMAADITRSTAYRSRETSVRFREGWDEALTTAMELLEAEARRRAMTVSDTLLIFLLKAHNPAKYRDRYEPPPVIDAEFEETVWTLDLGEPGAAYAELPAPEDEGTG